jgi:hypothetical protein
MNASHSGPLADGRTALELTRRNAAKKMMEGVKVVVGLYSTVTKSEPEIGRREGREKDLNAK